MSTRIAFCRKQAEDAAAEQHARTRQRHARVGLVRARVEDPRSRPPRALSRPPEKRVLPISRLSLDQDGTTQARRRRLDEVAEHVPLPLPLELSKKIRLLRWQKRQQSLTHSTEVKIILPSRTQMCRK